MPKQNKAPRLQLRAWIDAEVERSGNGRQVVMDLLSTQIGCKRVTMYQWLSGEREPGREPALRLLKVAGIEWL
jgi:hypothetical protein